MSATDPHQRLDRERDIDALCDRFELAWRDGKSPQLPVFLRDAPAELRPRVLAELWAIERHYRRGADGGALDDAQLRLLHPELEKLAPDALKRLTSMPTGDARPTWIERLTPGELSLELLEEQLADGRPTNQRETRQHTAPAIGSRGLHIRCPHCRAAVELLADAPVDHVNCESCGSNFSLVDSADQSKSAQALETLGRFDLLARLGVGGFGTVWKARDTELDRIVAVKIPRKGQLRPKEVEQFLREARAAAQLRHPNIVPVFEVGKEGDTLFIVSEYVRGVPLSEWLSVGRRDMREVAALCATIADALDAAHAEGVIHRDLKPSNVMLDLSGRPRLMDFGLAKREVGEATMTVDGQVLGTPAYMSPEQARGEGHWTDRRTDIYSLGVMLFQMLTGELPFRGSAQMQIHQRMTDEAPDPRSLDRSVPRDLATLCLKCMEQDPNRRYPTAASVADELRRFVEGRPIEARPISRTARGLRWARRNPAPAAAIALAAILAVGGPTAAVMIESQRRQIATRLAERDTLLEQQIQRRDALQARIDALRQQLALLGGADPDDSPPAPWRKRLVESLLAQRYDAYREQLADAEPGEEVAKAHFGLALLLHSAGREEDAEEHLRQSLASSPPPTIEARAALRLATLELQSGAKQQARETLDRACDAIARMEGKPIAAELQTVELERIAAQLADDTQKKLRHLGAAREARKEVEQSWPEEVADIYDLANQLLERD